MQDSSLQHRITGTKATDLKSFALNTLNTGSSFTYLPLTTPLIFFSLHTSEIFAPVTPGIRPFSFSAWRPLEKAFFRLLSYASGASLSLHLKCQNPSVKHNYCVPDVALFYFYSATFLNVTCFKSYVINLFFFPT